MTGTEPPSSPAEEGTARFFAFARTRHAITLARAAGQPRPWTDDPILQQYRFTNVFREMDRTTVWIREHVRSRLEGLEPWQIVLGMVLARTFNRVETLEQIFCQERLVPRTDPIAWSYLRGEVTGAELCLYMRRHCPKPWVTGAYIVKTPDGMDKLDGALWIVEQARQRLPATVARPGALASMQSLHERLVTYPYLGGFTAYEIVSDLRHTAVGRDWPDIMTWAHAGPGAVRGLHRVHGRDHKKPLPQAQGLAEMRELLELSRDDGHWPQLSTFFGPGRDTYVQKIEHGVPAPGEWPRWEMREVEHTLCEFDKMERVRLGQGRPRGVYR